MKVWENSKKAAARVPTAFLVLPNPHSCFYNSIETRKVFSISQLSSKLMNVRFPPWRHNEADVLSVSSSSESNISKPEETISNNIIFCRSQKENDRKIRFFEYTVDNKVYYANFPLENNLTCMKLRLDRTPHFLEDQRSNWCAKWGVIDFHLNSM